MGNSIGAAHDPSVAYDGDTSPRFAQGGIPDRSNARERITFGDIASAYKVVRKA